MMDACIVLASISTDVPRAGMFEELQRELERLAAGVQIPVELALDERDYLDRQCPSVACGVSFKVLFEDWRDIVSDPAAFCPICGHEAEAQDFSTSEQDRYFGDAGLAYVRDAVGRAMEADSARFNATQSSGFISMSMSVSRDAPPLLLPAEAAEALRQDHRCESCACRFSTIGAAFFCPACKRMAAAEEFEAAAETLQQTLDHLDKLTATMAAATNLDRAADFRRQLLEDAVENLATMLQRRTETLFGKLPIANRSKRDPNVFQRLEDASGQWERATGTRYEDLLEEPEWRGLLTMMQRRHKIGHAQAHVDDRYVERTGDTRTSPGQRLVISVSDVYQDLAAVRKLIAGLEKLV